MTKRKLSLLLLLIATLVIFALPSPNIAKADITVTRTFTSSTSDGYIYTNTTDFYSYGTTEGTVVSSATSLIVGRTRLGSSPYYYAQWRSYVFFDTSVIPDTATITSVDLSLYVTANNNVTDYNATVYSGMPTYPHDPLQAGDYYYNWYGETSGGTRSSTTMTESAYWNITLTSTGMGWINMAGTTKFFIQSSRTSIDGFTGDEYTVFSSAEAGSSYAPLLIVTYTVSVGGEQGGGGVITLHGPYLETGLVFNGTVNATLYYASNQSETYVFDGTDGEADTISSESDEMPVCMYWNMTSDYTKQRVYFFNPSASADEVWLHVADTDVQSVNQYYVSITDFAGLTNGYVSVTKNIAGTTRTIEVQPLDVMNNIPFWLITYNQYALKLTSDQGTFTWSLPADVIGTKSYVVTKDMITQVSTARNFTVSATRINGSIINIQYYDPEGATLSVVGNITYYANYVWNVAYTQTDTSSDVNYNWTTAEPTRKYTVTITANTTGGTYTWQYGLDVPVLTNPFGDSLNLIGNLPFPVNQLPGLIIAGIFFGLLSWRDTEIGCAIGLAVTGILCMVGLLNVPVMAIAMGFMFVVFMYLHKGKETLRVPP